MSSCNLGNGDGIRCLVRGVDDGEANGRSGFLRVSGGVAGCGVYRFEAGNVVSYLMLFYVVSGRASLLAKVVSKVSNRIFGIPHQLRLRLCAVVLFAIDVGEDRRYLAIWMSCSAAGEQTEFGLISRTVTHLPPRSRSLLLFLPKQDTTF
jgi:hypothetical protein